MSSAGKTDIVLGDNIHFPGYGEKSLTSQVVFVTGKRGSGKSWTTGVMMEEMERLKLQFVCFDTLGAHKGLEKLDHVESIKPREDETIDMNGLVERIASGDKSLIIDLTGCGLAKQQLLIADYCEALIDAKIGHNHNKTLMSIFEECQDYVPQQGKPVSHNAIVRLCKLGRGLGYGCTLVTQRPAACSKEAVSQASIYLTHNVINARDLKALEDQLSFGTDKERIKRILQGVTAAQKGECVAFAPEFFRNSGYIRIGKIRGDRRAPHSGGNVSAKPITAGAEGEHQSFGTTSPASSLAYPATMTPLTSFGSGASNTSTDWKAASQNLPNPVNPYSATDMGADNFRAKAEEPEQVWLPPIDYSSESSFETEIEVLEVKDNGPFGAAGPLVGVALACAFAGGTYLIVKGFNQ